MPYLDESSPSVVDPFPLKAEQDSDGSLEDLLPLGREAVTHHLPVLQQGDQALLQVQLDRAGLEGVDRL